MKKFFVMLALPLMVLSSCDSTLDVNADENLPALVGKDFSCRYPNAAISHFENYRCDNTTRISFWENDGLESTAIYLDGDWMMTQKEYHYENFLFEIPRNVAKTYLGTGVDGEEYLSDSDYIVEVSRIGFDQRQYEFHFTTPFIDEAGNESHLVNNIVISEDGSLLTFDHFGGYNRSITWYDMRVSHKCVVERYPSSSVMGVVNIGGNNVFFVKDKGMIKTVCIDENIEMDLRAGHDSHAVGMQHR